jgi:hypothetical protein
MSGGFFSSLLDMLSCDAADAEAVVIIQGDVLLTPRDGG